MALRAENVTYSACVPAQLSSNPHTRSPDPERGHVLADRFDVPREVAAGGGVRRASATP